MLGVFQIMDKINILSDCKFSSYMFINYGFTEIDLSELTFSSLKAFYMDYLNSMLSSHQ